VFEFELVEVAGGGGAARTVGGGVVIVGGGEVVVFGLEGADVRVGAVFAGVEFLCARLCAKAACC
jgi:hypothetical protein